MTATAARPVARSMWRSVVVPTEHGGWGLTLEPALLGMLVAPSVAGAALASAAFLAFMARTPLKLVLVDQHRHRHLDRTRAAAIVAVVELASLAALVAVAAVTASGAWLLPIVGALPFFAVELWYDARSRGRRLLPELCGATGIAAVVAAIALADGQSWTLAIALWGVLTARAIASVTFARGQVLRLRSGSTSTRASDVAQVAGIGLAVAAWFVDPAVGLGVVSVGATIVAQVAWSRGPARPAQVVGFSQLAFGLSVVAATALGVALA